VTTNIAAEDFPTWSPDGRTIAYQSTENGNYDIWVKQIGSTEAVNRTEDYLGDDRFPSFSPDGRQIAFRSARDGGGGFVMPAIGGPARKVPSQLSTQYYPQWSADGTEHPLTDLEDRPGNGGDPATDGEHLYFLWGDNFSDLWVMNVVRE